MINHKSKKISLNLSKTAKNDNINDLNIEEKNRSIVDNFMNKQHKNTKLAILNESSTEINNVASNLFNNLGIVVNDFNEDSASTKSVLKRVDTYLSRFPELDYLIDMISSSAIYTSSSNNKKIQFTLNGEYRTLKKPENATNFTDSTSDSTSDVTSIEDPKLEIQQIDIDGYQTEQVDSQYEDLNLEVGSLFKKNNIKLSLYSLMNSIIKYGYGLFYVNDSIKQDDVSFYGLDEVKFIYTENEVRTNAILNKLNNNTLYDDNEEIFISVNDNEEIKKINTKELQVILNEDNSILDAKNLFFISEKGVFGKSLVVKVIHYLKIIELLELSLLIERLSKTKTTHIQKLDLSKIEEEDVAPTMMLYRNLINNQMSMQYDEDSDNMSLDIVKNLVDSNILVPTEDKNLDISTLKSEFKPLLDDISYYWDKVYLSMGIPIHYRKGTDSKAYVNNNMLVMHDNVYSMKIRHYQLVINNLLTFQIENQLNANYKDLTIKFLNINIPEFIPISERKETDLDKSSKFVTMFTQLEQMLGIKIKEDFILNKLFPNDIISDIVDINTEEDVEEDINDMQTEDTEEDIASLFESSVTKLRNESGVKLFTIKKFNNFNLIKYNLKLNIEQ